MYIEDKTYEDLVDNTMLSDAIIRNLEVIGEIINQIPEEIFETEPSIYWKNLIGMRNLLIHAYHRVDLEIFWHTIHFTLPDVYDAVNRIIEKLDDLNN
jgi:uncharacterized protein with HEPN domain